jgi:hypothetical protein
VNLRIFRLTSAALFLAPVVFAGACGGKALSHMGATAGTGAPAAAGTTGAAGTIGGGGSTGAAGEAPVLTPPPIPDTVPHDGDVLTTAPEEIVSRLGKLLWNDAPDELAALTLVRGLPAQPTRGDARALAEKMLADRHAFPLLYDFYRWWLNAGDSYAMEKSPTWFPELDAGLRTSFSYELELFGAGVTMDGTGLTTDDAAKTGAPEPGTFRSLLGIESTFADDRLAKLYGLPAGSIDQPWARVANPGRPGLLALAGYIAPRGGYDRRWPAEIGMHVIQDFLCVRVPPEPASGTARPTPDPTQSMRKLAMAVTGAQCAACHRPVDGIGFGFLGYDALGRTQTSDGPDPVDDSGTLTLVKPERAFRGVGELGRALAAAPEAQRCHAAKWLGYFTKRETDVRGSDVTVGDVDQRSLDQAYAAFAVSGFKLRSLAAAAATSSAVLP